MSKKKLRPRNKTTGFYLLATILTAFLSVSLFLLATTPVNASKCGRWEVDSETGVYSFIETPCPPGARTTIKAQVKAHFLTWTWNVDSHDIKYQVEATITKTRNGDEYYLGSRQPAGNAIHIRSVRLPLDSYEVKITWSRPWFAPILKQTRKRSVVFIENDKIYSVPVTFHDYAPNTVFIISLLATGELARENSWLKRGLKWMSLRD